MPQTPLIPMAAGSTAATFPATGWLRLPDARTVLIQSVYVSESLSARDDVQVQAVVQFTNDFGFTSDASNDVALGAGFTRPEPSTANSAVA